MNITKQVVMQYIKACKQSFDNSLTHKQTKQLAEVYNQVLNRSKTNEKARNNKS